MNSTRLLRLLCSLAALCALAQHARAEGGGAAAVVATQDGEPEAPVDAAQEMSDAAALKAWQVLSALPNVDNRLEGMTEKQALTAEGRLKLAKLWETRQAELAEVMSAIEDEAKLMERLSKTVESADSDEDSLLAALQSLQDLVSFTDNARDFVTVGGFTRVMMRLNDSSAAVRSKAARVLGVSLRHEPAVKAHAMAVGLLPRLQAVIASTDMVADAAALRRQLFALSALVEHNSEAHQQLLASDTAALLLRTVQTGLSSAQKSTWKPTAQALAVVVDLLADDSLPAQLRAQLTSRAFCSEAEKAIRVEDEGSSASLLTQHALEMLLQMPRDCVRAVDRPLLQKLADSSDDATYHLAQMATQLIQTCTAE